MSLGRASGPRLVGFLSCLLTPVWGQALRCLSGARRWEGTACGQAHGFELFLQPAQRALEILPAHRQVGAPVALL